MNAETTIASLNINDAASMTPEGRKQIAQWLRDSAASLVKDGKNYSKRFRARYIVGK